MDIFHVGRNDGAGFFYYVMELADAAEAAEPQRDDVRWRMDDGKGAIVHPPSSSLDPQTYIPRTLKHDLRTRGPWPVAETLQIALSLTHALEHLHGHGLVHRDIKPSNIIFVKSVPKLADIGLVTSIDATRSFVGTDGYIPPEGPGTPQADLYSLGKVLYQLVTGKDRLDFPELPDNWRTYPEREQLLEFNEIITKTCDDEPRQRYQSGAEMGADIELLQTGQSVKNKRAFVRRWNLTKQIALAAIGVALLGASGTLVLHELNRNGRASFNPEANKLYQQAVYQLHKSTPESFLDAFTNLNDAIRLDPTFVKAHYGLFEIYWCDGGRKFPPKFEYQANMRWLASRLKELDPLSAEFHVVNSYVEWLAWHFDEALKEIDKAIRVEPKFVRAHALKGFYLLHGWGAVRQN